jgi:hypothetical protein
MALDSQTCAPAALLQGTIIQMKGRKTRYGDFTPANILLVCDEVPSATASAATIHAMRENTRPAHF